MRADREYCTNSFYQVTHLAFSPELLQAKRNWIFVGNHHLSKVETLPRSFCGKKRLQRQQNIVKIIFTYTSANAQRQMVTVLPVPGPLRDQCDQLLRLEWRFKRAKFLPNLIHVFGQKSFPRVLNLIQQHFIGTSCEGFVNFFFQFNKNPLYK